MPPTQPESFSELSGQRRKSALNEEIRYQPIVMLRVVVVVPIVGQEDPAVQTVHEISSEEGLLS